MAYTYNPALPSDRDWIRYTLGDTEFVHGASGTDGLVPDETYDTVLTMTGDKYAATVAIANGLITRFGQQPTQFSAGQGQMQVQFADRVPAWEDARDAALKYAPITAAMTTAHTQSVIYSADPYAYLPDSKRTLPK
jgi:hypothetical protein